MLRMDDTDIERSKEEYASQIQEDLKWLGMNWDMFARQSERMGRYDEIKQKLIDDGRLYPCFETAEEIDIKRKIKLNQGLPPIYDRAALNLTEAEKQKFISEGRQPHWRFRLDESATISWNDLIKGTVTFEAKNLSDPVLIRENGAPTYMLPSAIDDMDFGITHVMRGEDHVTNTAIQIQLFEAMGSKIPSFAHNSLMKGKDGKISKREGGFDVASLKKEHIDPMAITSFLARLGTSDPIEPRESMEELIRNFDISKFSRASAIYDYAELERINSKVLHIMPYEKVKDLEVMKGVDKEFWETVRHNLGKIDEIVEWWSVCKKPISPIIEDEEFAKVAADLLPDGNWDENTWGQWVGSIKEATSRKGKELFHPLRLAITAKESGPELKHLLPLIGRKRVLARLNKEVA